MSLSRELKCTGKPKLAERYPVSVVTS